MTELKEKNQQIGKKQTSVGNSRLLFFACWLVYACSYIARGNFSFARSLMIEGAVIGAGIAGTISAVYFICYAVGQLVNGALADRLSPFLMVSLGLFLVAVTNFAMTLSQSAVLFCVLWGLNGIGQSMLWSPVFFIISNALNDKVKFFAVTVVSLCTPAGKTLSGLLSGVALRDGRWENVFYMASLIVVAVSILWIAVYLSVRRDIVITRQEQRCSEKRTEKQNSSTVVSTFRMLLSGGLLLLVLPLLIHGLFYNGVIEVIPSILSTQYGLSPSAAAVLDAVIPIIGVSGVFFSNFVYLKMFRRNEVKGAAFCMIACVVPVAVMLLMSLFGGDGSLFGKYADACIFVVSYGVIYVLQLAFGHLIISIMAMKYSKFSLAATVSGFTNAVNYGGSAIATYGMSYAVEELPLWGMTVLWLGCLCVAGVALFFATRRWTAFSKKNNFI